MVERPALSALMALLATASGESMNLAVEEEMNIARTIQIDLLPKVFPSGDDFHFSAFSVPEPGRGSGSSDFIKTRRGTIAVVIADASGKGVRRRC